MPNSSTHRCIVYAGDGYGEEDYQTLSKECARLVPLTDGYQQLQQLRQEMAGLEEMLAVEPDNELVTLAEQEIELLQQQKEDLMEYLLDLLLPPDEATEQTVLLELRKGEGGAYASPFASELMEMYRNYSAQQAWSFEVLEYSEQTSVLDKVKSVSSNRPGVAWALIRISGTSVYSKLRWESGTHKASFLPKCRHTNEPERVSVVTATVAVVQEPAEVDLDIADSDLRVEEFKGSGKKTCGSTGSAIRVTHVPTGTAATCQGGSQAINRKRAFRDLRCVRLAHSG
eukprot:GHUV01018004.1.p1 GENE.GHUV01018004.1~~GHUV01018004.1.p1  ORF type:complete len:285 (+),score=51.07 GHUV01018004.1:823-1677(+)